MLRLLLIFTITSVTAACSDKSNYCKAWKDLGYCTSYRAYMETNCKLTCGLCAAPPTLPPLNCVDKSGYCSSYKPYCKDPGYVDYLQKECKLTCDYCHITTTPPPTTKPTQPYTGSAGRGLQSNCGHKGPGHTRIVGGSNSKPGDWPWQVNIEYSENTGNPGNWCGGTLINDQWILSAAHCFNDDPVKSKYVIKLGEHDLKTPTLWEQKFTIAELIMHPKYDPVKNHDYDLALVRLNTNVNFTDRVRPACIPEHTTDFVSGTECYISGWGLLKEYGTGPAILQQAKVPLVDKQVCQKAFNHLGHKLTSRMLCAGYSSRSIDSCQGDSGGPLVCKKRDSTTNEDVWYLWGAISWGVGCARKDLYGVYANTKYMSEWITNIAFK